MFEHTWLHAQRPRTWVRARSRWLAALTAGLLVLTAACGSGDDSSSDDGGDDTTADTSRAGQDPEATPGFDGTTINLGVITPLTGLVSVIGLPLTRGNEVYWDSVNAEGGVGGRYPVELLEEDSRYTPQDATQAYGALKGNVVAFQQILGTQITNSLLPQMETDNLSAAPATLDAEWVTNPNLFPLGGPYQVQAINGLAYYTEQEGTDGTFCGLVQDDAYGTAAEEGLEYAADELGFDVAQTATFATGADFTAPIQQLKDAGCEVVLVGATAADASGITSKAISLQLDARLIALAPFWLPAFGNPGDTATFLGEHLWLASEGPNWGDTAVPGMAQMLAAQEQYAPDQQPDPYFAFGYAQGWAVHQILEKAVENGDLGPDGIKAASNLVGTLTFDGLIGDYLYGDAPADRDPPRSTAIFGVVPNDGTNIEVLTEVESDAAKSYSFEG